MDIKISIIVPVYRVEKYLEQNIVSLLNQTYQNFEIILVDDGSPDNSGEICDKYALKDNRVTVVHKSNEGLGFARNSGLDVASGDYVSFIDSDDYVAPDMLEQLIKPIIENNADTVIGGFQRVSDLGEIKYQEKYKKQMFSGEEIINTFLPKIFGSNPKKHDAFRMSVWNGLYSMKIIQEHNVRFPSERIMISEDLLFDFDYYQYAKLVVVTDSIAYYYRVNPTSLTNKYRDNKLEMVTALYVEMERKIKSKYSNPKEAIDRLQTQYFINLRGCIQQENRRNSNHGFIDNYRRIKTLCKHPVVISVSKTHPLKRLDFRQKVFVLLLRHRLAIVFIILLKLGKL